MKLSVRQSEILAQLQAHSKLDVELLAERYSVSPQTIRKDMNRLCEQGLARRVHGGINLPARTHNVSFNSRVVINAPVKRAIARALARHIPDGASLFMGIGTTVAHAAHALLEHRGLRVLTNNLDVVTVFCGHPEIEVLVSGGRLRHSDRDLAGEPVTRFIEQYQVDYALLGCGGLDIQAGLLEFDPLEADISRAAIRNARRRILLADRSKWQREAMVKVAPIREIDLLISDSLPACLSAEQLTELGVVFELTEDVA